MTKRNVLIAAIAGVVAVAGAVWFLFIRSDAPPPASLEEAVESITETTAPSEPDEPVATTAPAETTSAPAELEGLDGAWVIDQESSFAGYRIGEELASIGTVEAVGRTSDVEALLTFRGTAVTELTATVDMTTLQSDRSRRDGALRTRGLETDAFPTATFVLTEPIDLGAVPADGETFTASAVGDLSLHGVANEVGVELEGQVVGETVVVVGSTQVLLTDYDIEAPTGFSVLTIEETGTLEVQLVFVRS